MECHRLLKAGGSKMAVLKLSIGDLATLQVDGDELGDLCLLE